MGIWKIDGMKKDGKGRKNEEEFNINLIVRNDGWGVQLDVEITPLFCTNCNEQLEGFFKHQGSRYGLVGTVICNNCGATISCTDNDNIVENLKVCTDNGEYIIGYYKLYKLEKAVWLEIKKKTNYDIVERHKNNTITLQEVIKEICEEYGIKLSFIETDFLETNEKIKTLPKVVNRWIALLNYLDIKNKEVNYRI